MKKEVTVNNGVHPRIEFYLPTKVVFKQGAIEEVGKEAAQFGEKALLVTGKKAMKKFGITSMVQNFLINSGVEVIIYDQVEPEPSIQTVDRGGNLANLENCELIIGLGGGSVLDVSKGISLIAKQGSSISKFLENKDKEQCFHHSNVLPVIAIPTTSGTGSEVTPFALFTDLKERRKKALGNPLLYPKVALVDPELMMKMPPKLVASTGIDALGHAIEAYISRRANVVSDMFAKEAINLIIQNLRQCVVNRNDKEAQKNMGLASTFAGIAISQAGVVAGHAMATSLGGYFGIPHGTTVGIFLPYALELNRSIYPRKVNQVAKMFGVNLENISSDGEKSKRLIDVIKNFIKEVGLPNSLRQKIDSDLVLWLAREAFAKPAMNNNPSKLKIDDVAAVINQILA